LGDPGTLGLCLWTLFTIIRPHKNVSCFSLLPIALKEFIINDLFSSVIFVKHLRIHLYAGPVTRFGTILFVEILLYSSPEALCFLTKFLFQRLGFEILYLYLRCLLEYLMQCYTGFIMIPAFYNR